MLMVLQEQKGSTRVRSCQSCLCVSFFSVPLPSSYTHFSVFHVKSVMCPWLLPSVFRAHHVAVSLSFPVLSLGLCLLFPVLFWSSFLVIMFSFASVFASPVSLCQICAPPSLMSFVTVSVHLPLCLQVSAGLVFYFSKRLKRVPLITGHWWILLTLDWVRTGYIQMKRYAHPPKVILLI